jgi:hypothetical protein
LPSQDEPAQPSQGPDELAAAQTPLMHEDGFWQGFEASQDHPLQLQVLSVYFEAAIVLLFCGCLPPITGGIAADSVRSKAS